MIAVLAGRDARGVGFARHVLSDCRQGPPAYSTPRRSIAAVLAALLLVGTAAGCQTVGEHKPTAIGAGAGAAGGAVIGGLIAKNTTGVVVGGLLGGLAGGAIGYYLERRDRDRAQAATASSYTPAQGTVVRVERVESAPSALRAGETVNLLATYTVLTPNDQQLTIRETREVRHGGALVANPTTEFQRVNGTFTSGVPITLPGDARRGTYEVTTTVAAGDRVSRSTHTFSVQ